MSAVANENNESFLEDFETDALLYWRINTNAIWEVSSSQ